MKTQTVEDMNNIKPEDIGQSVYVIWSMSFDWEPDGDPNGKAVNFDCVNHMGTFRTMKEAEAALMKLEADDENWSEDSIFDQGGIAIYWIIRETAMMSREVEIEPGYVPRRKRDQWGKLIHTPKEIEHE